MSSSRVFVAALAVASLITSACAMTPIEGDVEEQVASTDESLIMVNGDLPSFFWLADTQGALKRLAIGALVRDDELARTPLRDSDLGRKVLHYVVACALPPGKSAKISDYGVELHGEAGLAESWAGGPLSQASQQRWVTACLLQTLNGIGVHVPIRMIGSHPGLADAPGDDVSKFIYPDAIMFGNLFADVPAVYACWDPAVVRMCGGMWSQYAADRVCDQADFTCGIKVLGACDDVCSLDRDGFPTCDAPAGVSYPESIKTQLTADGLGALYRGCLLP